MADLERVSGVTEELGISRATIFRVIAAGELALYRRRDGRRR
jgi:hypothetical protein